MSIYANCYNTLTITGNYRQRSRFLNTNQLTKHDLLYIQKLCRKDEIAYMTAEILCISCLSFLKHFLLIKADIVSILNNTEKNLGTTCEPFHANYKAYKKKLVYNFTTRHSPPSRWLKIMAYRYPKLTFILRYYIYGSQYRPYIIYKKGQYVPYTPIDEDKIVRKHIEDYEFVVSYDDIVDKDHHEHLKKRIKNAEKNT